LSSVRKAARGNLFAVLIGSHCLLQRRPSLRSNRQATNCRARQGAQGGLWVSITVLLFSQASALPHRGVWQRNARDTTFFRPLTRRLPRPMPPSRQRRVPCHSDMANSFACPVKAPPPLISSALSTSPIRALPISRRAYGRCSPTQKLSLWKQPIPETPWLAPSRLNALRCRRLCSRGQSNGRTAC